MGAWNWAAIFTVTGALLEGVGLAFVFVELAFIRSHEFGVPPRWERIQYWIRRLLRRPVVVKLSGGNAVSVSGGAARVVVRPSEPAAGATDRERIDRLERYVKSLDDDLNSVWKTALEHRDAAIEEAKRLDEEMRREIERREEQRKAEVRRSLTRQTLGALLVGAGLTLGTIGNLI